MVRGTNVSRGTTTKKNGKGGGKEEERIQHSHPDRKKAVCNRGKKGGEKKLLQGGKEQRGRTIRSPSVGGTCPLDKGKGKTQGENTRHPRQRRPQESSKWLE